MPYRAVCSRNIIHYPLAMSLKISRVPILETARLRLDPLVPDDAALIFPLMADHDVMAFWDVPEFDDPDIVAEIVAGHVSEMAAGKAIYWTIRTLAAASVSGTCDFS